MLKSRAGAASPRGAARGGALVRRRRSKARAAEPASPRPPPDEPRDDGMFPIVGIGASAGGLEAIEEFLRIVPEGSGLAIVVVTHLDPTHKGVMPELLQRVTPMKVFQARDRMRVKRDCVYVIPPNRDMSILRGVLHLFEPAAPRGLRLPIDFFFRSLADDRRERSIGVVLSGMGSDGTVGLRAIREAGGLVLVQEPSSARFDGMPRSAIEAGLADVVAPAGELPPRLLSYLRHAPILWRTAPALEGTEKSALEKVAILLRARTGHDFSLYKNSTVRRRIERRMGIHHVDRISAYVKILQKSPEEVELLFRELLIGVTGFFRDAAAWIQLRDEALPALLAARPPEATLRAWSAGCSTGEEAFSLAMTFREVLDKARPRRNVSLQVFATDLDAEAVQKARQGLFPPSIAADVSPARLKRFFSKENGGRYRISKEIREMVTFATQNVIMDPPFTRLDILVCRNLLIYFAPELQRRLLRLFHYCLTPGGILFLGSAETSGGHSELFHPIPGKSRLYTRAESLLAPEAVSFPVADPQLPAVAPKEARGQMANLDLMALADNVLLQQFAPPAVLVNDKGDILFVSGRTGKYLEPAAGKANWNVFVMAREGLRFALAEEFHKVVRTGVASELRNVKAGSGRGAEWVNVTLRPLSEPAVLRGTVMIVFSDAPAQAEPDSAERSGKAGPARNRSTGLQGELQRSHEALAALRAEMQAMREEMQTSQEELKSTNEELQSTNEELQSTNEELTTSKEELQSLNEELQTVNSEQVARMDELSRANDDMKNLLTAADIATVFLDAAMRVRRFTAGATTLFKLIPADVGRPLSDIATSLRYPALLDDAEGVLRSLVFSEKQAETIDGRWFNVRIVPYRTVGNVIEGVMITFSEVTTAKALEDGLRRAMGGEGGLLGGLPLGFALQEVLGDPQGMPTEFRFLAVNPSFERLCGLPASAIVGRTAREVFPGAADEWIGHLGRVAVTGEPDRFEVHLRPGGERLQATVYRPSPGQVACTLHEVERAGRPGSAPRARRPATGSPARTSGS